MATPAPAAPNAVKKTKVRVRATVLIFNGSHRIREGTVFDMEVEAGKPLPRCVELVEEKEAEVVSIGKRERGPQPTNLAKDQPGR